MPSAIVVTVGSASANSYVTVANGDTYFDNRLNSSAWADATDDDKARALLQAAQRLERENWIGTRASTTQALAWPRSGAAKVDSGTGYFSAYGWGFQSVYEVTEIPQPVKDAQCEFALSLLAQGAAIGAGQSRVKSFTADGLSVAREYSAPVGSLPSEVMRLISALIRGPQLVRA